MSTGRLVINFLVLKFVPTTGVFLRRFKEPKRSLKFLWWSLQCASFPCFLNKHTYNIFNHNSFWSFKTCNRSLLKSNWKKKHCLLTVVYAATQCSCFGFSVNQIKQKKSLSYSQFYAEACNEWRGPSPRLSVWQHSSEEMSQRWRAVGDCRLSELVDRGIEPKTSRTGSDVFNDYTNRPVLT